MYILIFDYKKIGLLMPKNILKWEKIVFWGLINQYGMTLVHVFNSDCKLTICVRSVYCFPRNMVSNPRKKYVTFWDGRNIILWNLLGLRTALRVIYI